jgi:hypothetical protein
LTTWPDSRSPTFRQWRSSFARDQPTAQRAAAAGASWLREQAGIAGSARAAPAPDRGELADRVPSRLAMLFTWGACGNGQDPGPWAAAASRMEALADDRAKRGRDRRAYRHLDEADRAAFT